jgi:hypothetical protein
MLKGHPNRTTRSRFPPAPLARDVHLIFLRVDAKGDDYRQDPRFVALLARCGFSR